MCIYLGMQFILLIFFCTDHYNDIEMLYDDIVKACVDATPTSCQGLTNIRQKKKPGWNDVKALSHLGGSERRRFAVESLQFFF